jgi:hypothetical protein
VIDLLSVTATAPPFTYVGVAAAPAGARNLLAAIQERVLATPAISGALPGGLWRGLADEEARTPYGEVHVLGESNLFDTGPAYAKQARFQVTLYGEDADILEDLQLAFEDAFHHRMTPLPIRGGKVVIIQVTGGYGQADEGTSRSGRPLKQHVVELAAIVTRTLPS